MSIINPYFTNEKINHTRYVLIILILQMRKTEAQYNTPSKCQNFDHWEYAIFSLIIGYFLFFIS